MKNKKYIEELKRAKFAIPPGDYTQKMAEAFNAAEEALSTDKGKEAHK